MNKKDLKLILMATRDDGMSQRRLSRILGLDERTVRRYVSGDLPIPQVVALAIEYVADAEPEDWNRLERSATNQGAKL